MNVKLLSILACALIVLASCTQTESVTVPDENEGEVWLSLNVRLPQATRGLVDGPDNSIDNGTGEESNVEVVKAILFNGFDSFSTVTDVTYVNVTPGAPASVPFKVSQDAQALLIIANPNESLLPAIEVGVTTYGQINQEMVAMVKDLTGENKNYFMMTNASGRLEPWDGSSIQNFTKLSAAEAQLPGAAFSMNIDRVVSKVRLYNDFAPGGTRAVGVMNVGELTWGLNMTNKWLYPVSERLFTAIQMERGYPYSYPYTFVHSDPYGLGTYRIDPNFEGPVGLGGFIDPEIHAQYFNFYNPDDPAGYEINFKPATTGSSGEGTLENNVEYCLENTFSEEFSYHGWTTHVVVRANVYPQNVVMPGGGIGPGPSAGESWLRISGVDYTKESLNARIQYELDGPNGVNSLFVIAFDNFLLTTANLWIDLNFPLAMVKSSFEDVIMNQLGNDLVPSPLMWESPQYGLFAFYQDGISYYTIMIKHDNDNDPAFENRLGEFGVVRNSVYDIRINSISGPGFPEIPGPDPLTPNESGEIYMAIEIDSNPWTWYSQVEDL